MDPNAAAVNAVLNTAMIAVPIWILSTLLTIWIAYAVLRAAIRGALLDRYKVVRWYELTGEWERSSGPWTPPREAHGVRTTTIGIDRLMQSS